LGYDIIERRIAALERHRAELLELADALDSAPVDLEDRIFRYYIECGKLGDVAGRVNAEGLRKDARKYAPSDISAVIQGRGQAVDRRIVAYGRQMFEANSNSRWGKVRRCFEVPY